MSVTAAVILAATPESPEEKARRCAETAATNTLGAPISHIDRNAIENSYYLSASKLTYDNVDKTVVGDGFYPNGADTILVRVDGNQVKVRGTVTPGPIRKIAGLGIPPNPRYSAEGSFNSGVDFAPAATITTQNFGQPPARDNLDQKALNFVQDAAQQFLRCVRHE